MPDELSTKEEIKLRAQALLPLCIKFFMHYYYKSKKIEVENYYDKIIRNQPVEFEFYCQYCLHQTNEHAETCPKCKEGRLVGTGRE